MNSAPLSPGKKMSIFTDAINFGWTPIAELKDETRHVVVLSKEGALFIKFYGTIGKFWPPSKDWRQNWKIWKKSETVAGERYEVMDGFLQEYLSLRVWLFGVIEVARPQLIEVVGFSQGGAHATLFLDEALTRLNCPVRVLAAGCPRLFSFWSAKEFEKELSRRPDCSLTRLYSFYDGVCHAPPWLLNFRHVGKIQPVFVTHHSAESYLAEAKQIQTS